MIKTLRNSASASSWQALEPSPTRGRLRRRPIKGHQRGQAVGQVFNFNQITPTMAVGGFKWNNGSSSYLLPPSSYTAYPESAAWAINDDQGTATGVATDKSEALDINHLGELVGASDVVPPGSTKRYSAAYKTPGSGLNQGWVDLGVLGQGANAGDSSVAKSINPNGLIVGQSRIKVNGSFVTRAFVLSNQGNVGTQPLLNLNEYSWVLSSGQWYRADNIGWALISAERVNDAGWIVAYGVKSGTTRAVVLSPR